MNRPILALALATLLAVTAHADDGGATNLVAVNSPAFAAIPLAAPAPVKASPATAAPRQPLLQPLLEQMAQDLAGKVDQHASSSLTAPDQ